MEAQPTPTIEALLLTRQTHLEAIDGIDAALEERGVMPTRHITGRPATMRLAVLAVLGRGPASLQEIAKSTGQTHHAAQQMLYRMAKDARIVRLERGLYDLPPAGPAGGAAESEGGR